MDNQDYKIELWQSISFRDDMNAFESLFHLLNKKLIQFCSLYVHRVEIAEEVVADVFVKCWEGRKAMQEIKNIESYLFIAVKNHSINYLKKYSSITSAQLEEGNKYEIPDLFDPEKRLELKELSFRMEQAIESLPLQSQLVFRLVKEDGMKYKDVAEILSISPRTVQTQLYRAIKKLSHIFSAYQTQICKNKIVSIVMLTGILQIIFSSL